MALILRKLYQNYEWFLATQRDHRADRYPLTSSPVLVMIMAYVYVKFVKEWGPNFMKNRRPYNLEKIMRLYNLFQVLINGYLVIVATPIILKMDIRCAEIDFSESPEALVLLKLGYIYFLIKVVDLLDTVFFVLRKKDKQISFLHVYHHCGMAVITWLAVNFLAGGHSVYLGYINCIVHTVMYFYYFVSSLDEKYRKRFTWWKKHVTQLQLLQFLLVLIIYGRLLFVECGYPLYAIYVLLPQNLFMLILFSDFYRKAYMTPKTKESKIDTAKNDSINGSKHNSHTKLKAK